MSNLFGNSTPVKANQVRIQGGGTGGPDPPPPPPWKITSYMGFYRESAIGPPRKKLDPPLENVGPPLEP